MNTVTEFLSGISLDWAVAVCEGWRDWDGEAFLFKYKDKYSPLYLNCYSPSTNWRQGGLILERERIYCYPHPDGLNWSAVLKGAAFNAEGPTPLIAAMRCYVTSVLGDQVDVPDSLYMTVKRESL